MNRQQMMNVIQSAQDVPIQVRVAATVFLSRMTDRQIEALGTQAEQALSCVKNGDRPGFESSLSALGIPTQFVKFLGDKAFASGDDQKHG